MKTSILLFVAVYNKQCPELMMLSDSREKRQMFIFIWWFDSSLDSWMGYSLVSLYKNLQTQKTVSYNLFTSLFIV